jgi:hypothetical protein
METGATHPIDCFSLSSVEDKLQKGPRRKGKYNTGKEFYEEDPAKTAET